MSLNLSEDVKVSSGEFSNSLVIPRIPIAPDFPTDGKFALNTTDDRPYYADGLSWRRIMTGADQLIGNVIGPLDGSTPNTVIAIRNVPVAATAPNAGQVLTYNGAAWAPAAVPGSTITTQDEGVTLSTTVNTLNFVGAGITASGAGNVTTVTVPALTTQDEGVPLSSTVNTLNFVGTGVTASGAGNVTTVTIPGSPNPVWFFNFIANPALWTGVNCTVIAAFASFASYVPRGAGTIGTVFVKMTFQVNGLSAAGANNWQVKTNIDNLIANIPGGPAGIPLISAASSGVPTSDAIFVTIGATGVPYAGANLAGACSTSLTFSNVFTFNDPATAGLIGASGYEGVYDFTYQATL